MTQSSSAASSPKKDLGVDYWISNVSPYKHIEAKDPAEPPPVPSQQIQPRYPPPQHHPFNGPVAHYHYHHHTEVHHHYHHFPDYPAHLHAPAGPPYPLYRPYSVDYAPPGPAPYGGYTRHGSNGWHPSDIPSSRHRSHSYHAPSNDSSSVHSFVSSSTRDIRENSSLLSRSPLPPPSPLSISRARSADEISRVRCADEIINIESVFASNTVLDAASQAISEISSPSRSSLCHLQPAKLGLTILGFLRRSRCLVLNVRVTVTILEQIERYLLRRTAPVKFKSKFTNHAKGNFYISKPMIQRMMKECKERFDTDEPNDEKSAFGYYKESVAMQINDEQIKNVLETLHGDLLILINIDLHFGDAHPQRGERMYLVAMENDAEFVDKVRWCIVDFMSGPQIRKKYGVGKDKLPRSSRQMRAFQNGLNRPPTLSSAALNHIIWNTDFKHLPAKTSKRGATNTSATDDKGQARSEQPSKLRISQESLRYFVQRSWASGRQETVPVVVIKGKKQWIEWKRFIEVWDSDRRRRGSIGISLRYYCANRQWKIECMDYDAGRIYYQHRLVGDLAHKPHLKYTYDHLKGLITTQLDIYRQGY